METLGVWLRQTREARDETLRDVEVATRIRLRFLKMLEEGEFGALPGGEVQVRGFLRIYARHLGLSPDEVLTRYDREVHRVEPAPSVMPVEAQPVRPASPVPPARPPAARLATPSTPGSFVPVPQWLSLETVIIACIVLIFLLVILIAVMYVVSRSRGGGETDIVIAPATVSAGAVILSTQTAMAATALPTITPTFPVDPEGYVMLTLRATEHVWARVMVDGMLVFEGMLEPEQPKTWSGREEVVVETGNGAGLQVTVNGQSQGTMCGRAEACTRGWGLTGEISEP